MCVPHKHGSRLHASGQTPPPCKHTDFDFDHARRGRFKGLGPEELLLYQVIKSAGNTGLWTKDMKLRTNLPQPHITKVP